jgi:hypothetical protein
VKVATTLAAAFIVTAQVPVPEQPEPDQPAKVEPDEGAAVSVTSVAGANSAAQVAPQEIPAGLEVTVPVPLPPRETTSVFWHAPATHFAPFAQVLPQPPQLALSVFVSAQ